MSSGESVDSRHTSVTPSWNRIPGEDSPTSPSDNPSQGSFRERPLITPPPTRTEMDKRIQSIRKKKVELKNKLTYSEWDNDRTKRMLDNLQQAYHRRLEERDNLREQRDNLQEERDLLKLTLSQERKIAAQ
ncbi:hypothetical protein L6452_17783 [Arctium lappa]|uniref:Uncharacterized protein n=1 Tax=Arctium lappa TaxID=4217 RepID=A0ACB9C4H7_ARCLA|nr:hypothetical protein L6452_17783 [Arctium lappa]